jgi:hypothetical protein
MAFENMINTTGNLWTSAYDTLNSVNPNGTPAEFAKSLLEAQLKVAVATSAEQKTSAAMDKAYQAHGQVASK